MYIKWQNSKGTNVWILAQSKNNGRTLLICLPDMRINNYEKLFILDAGIAVHNHHLSL
jgi:hypothetical protein